MPPRLPRPLVPLLSALLLASFSAGTRADVRLPHVLSSHMVLQRDLATPIWGWADPGEEIDVAFAGQELKTRADAQGRWLVKLAPAKPGGPFELTLHAKNEIKLQDILVGDVWLCSGQSNMRFEVLSSSTSKAALAKADLPKIRLFYVPLRSAGQAVQDIASEWKVCTPASAARFTAVGFYFGRELNEQLDVPIGLIDASWSGSRIDAWIAPEGFASIPAYPDMTRRLAGLRQRWKDELLPWALKQGPDAAAFRDALEKAAPLPIVPEWPINSVEMNNRLQYTAGRETENYNGMIHPLAPFGLRGVIWYQGESNTRAWPLIDYALPDGSLTYVDKTRALINGWEKVWNQGAFPLYFVQIAPGKGYADDDLPRFWEAQTTAMQSIPNTGMAVTTDLTDLNNVHPPDKEDVGKRLALWALAKTYGKDVVYSGPIYKSMTIEGDKIRVAFDHAETGLSSRDGKPLTWFTIAGPDHKFVPAKAEIDGQTVVVWFEVEPKHMPQPLAVRFGWDNLAQPNLVNAAKLPASPFRTDRWDPLPPIHKPAADAARDSAEFLARNAGLPGVVTLPGGVQYLVLKEGEGLFPKPASQLTIVYRATLIDGSEFSAAPAANPATPRLQDVMLPLEQVLVKMKAGGKCRIFIPPDLAHGPSGFGPLIGPNAVLIYELDLQKIKP